MDKDDFYGTKELSVVVNNSSVPDIIKYLRRTRVDPNSFVNIDNTSEYVPLMYFFCLKREHEKVVRLLFAQKCVNLAQPPDSPTRELLFDCDKFYLGKLIETGAIIVNTDSCRLEHALTNCFLEGEFFRITVLSRIQTISDAISALFSNPRKVDELALAVLKKLITKITLVSAVNFKEPEKSYEPIISFLREYHIIVSFMIDKGLKPSFELLQYAVNYYLSDIVKSLVLAGAPKICPESGSEIKLSHHEHIFAESEDATTLVVCLRHLYNDFNYDVISRVLS
jgi:hypothetical protein